MTGPGITDATDMVNLGDEELMRNPFGGCSRIREQAPLVRGIMPGVQPAWLVTRYDDVKMVLSDSRFVVNSANVPGMRLQNLNEQIQQAHGTPSEYLKYRVNQVGAFDGAEHTRLRKLVAHAFTVRKVAKLRPLIQQVTEELLDRLPAAAENGVVGLLRHFAYPMTSTVLCELVGIPERDRPRWLEWREIIAPVPQQRKIEAWRDIVPYTRELIERRRAEPADDLISRLVRAHDEDSGRLSETELITMIVLLGLTGHTTSTHMIGNGAFSLLTHPDQLALLRDNPDLIPRAMHELLRWRGPSQVTPAVRYATEDLEIGGMPVRKGEAVLPVLVAANYDPRRFDRPDRLDITREPDERPETHVAFGGGAHYCLGAALARLEGEVAFEALLRRFPDITLGVDPADLEFELIPGHWRLAELPVKL